MLKHFIPEEYGDSVNVERFFDKNGNFDYSVYSQLSVEDRYNAAMAIIQSDKRRKLAEPEVYHIILSVGHDNILIVYDLATKYLTPDQLLNTKKQIDTFHR